MDSLVMNEPNTPSTYKYSHNIYIKYIVEKCAVSIETATKIAYSINNSPNPDGKILEEHEDILSMLEALSKLSRHHNKDSFVQQAFDDRNRWDYYENEEIEMISYLERVEYLISKEIDLIYVFKYAEDYNMDHLHQFISLIERGAPVESAWRMTGDFTPEQIDKYFAYVRLGVDANNACTIVYDFTPKQIIEFFAYIDLGFNADYSFQCTEEFHNNRFKKELVIRLFQSDLGEEMAFNIASRFTNDINMIQRILCVIDKKLPIKEIMDNLLNIDYMITDEVMDNDF